MLADVVFSWLSSRDWSIYPFVPSFISIIVSLGGTRPLTKRLESEVQKSISESPEKATAVINIAVTWNLKLQVLPAYVLIFVSWWAIFRHSPNMLFGGWLVFGLIGLLGVVEPVLLSPLGELNEELTEYSNDSYLQSYLAKRKMTYASFYSYILIGVHVVLLLAIFVTLPEASKW